MPSLKFVALPVPEITRGTQKIWAVPVSELEPGHRVTGSVTDFVRVGSGLGSKLFTYRPGIVTRFLTEQQNDTAAAVSMLGTHERIV